MKILMRNIGMTLHVIHTLRRQGIDNVSVNMDWQHLLMNGESLAEYAGLLAAEGLLGHLHANDGWGTFDDDNMVGTIRFMETLELAVELRGPATATTASASASISIPTPRTRSEP
jgi:xylose isomerase